jgi:hypothetical protein
VRTPAREFQNKIILPDKKYNIIYADPPWNSNSQFGRDKKKGNEQHYPLMTVEDIKNLPVKNIADGEYFVTTRVTWTISDIPQGGLLMQRVSVKNGETADIVLAP